MNKNILYVRNFASKVNSKLYNLQELGFGKALVNQGYNCDVVYYTDANEEIETVYQQGNHRLRILWMKGYKIFSNSIFTKLLSKKFANQYQFVITTEYHQMMTYLLSTRFPKKVILYHGPYKDHGRQLILKVYDRIFLPGTRRRVRYTFVKSELANKYLTDKGFTDVVTLGVGLDIENLENRQECNDEIEKELKKLHGKKVLLYIGILEARRNILFLLRLLKKATEQDPEIRLLFIGSGKSEETDEYWKYINDHHLSKFIVYFPKIEQAQLWRIYEVSDVMVFPTTYDIFGMVLLESLYYNVPVISSLNGGASTLIRQNENGIILNHFDEQLWLNVIFEVLEAPILKERMKASRPKTTKSIQWDNIVSKMISQIDC
ncbi:glycosyltransferase family 4 protein [Paenibacillus cellulositrophicus]|uniref:glycosyltransferase family 4 protein n=1 Tax=Paenibacillus cellulositrophicus TaxID=562959 RepID=UPI00204059B5|nr:glycosyltransferase family 4 protein [Paenibacillus cellulositrophicus]MCM2996626.1 glycosyltransferase family 4 protein [Paenibacillus cellulositrophicus]